VNTKLHLFSRLQTSASSSRSNISPTGIPNNAMRLSCRPVPQNVSYEPHWEPKMREMNIRH
jgi:hypothetical protein